MIVIAKLVQRFKLQTPLTARANAERTGEARRARERGREAKKRERQGAGGGTNENR